MTRPYLILINGVLAKRVLTFIRAQRLAAELMAKGMHNVSIAEEI